MNKVFNSFWSRTKSITANIAGSLFSIALKTCETGNDKRSIKKALKPFSFSAS